MPETKAAPRPAPVPDFCAAVYVGPMWRPVRCGRFEHRDRLHKALIPPREEGQDPRVLSWI